MGDRRTLLYVLTLCVTAVTMTAAWRFTPLEQYATPVRMIALTHAIRKTPWAPIAVILAYIVASCVMFPNTALNVAVVLGVGGIRNVAHASKAAATSRAYPRRSRRPIAKWNPLRVSMAH